MSTLIPPLVDMTLRPPLPRTYSSICIIYSSFCGTASSLGVGPPVTAFAFPVCEGEKEGVRGALGMEKRMNRFKAARRDLATGSGPRARAKRASSVVSAFWSVSFVSAGTPLCPVCLCDLLPRKAGGTEQVRNEYLWNECVNKHISQHVPDTQSGPKKCWLL